MTHDKVPKEATDQGHLTATPAAKLPIGPLGELYSTVIDTIESSVLLTATNYHKLCCICRNMQAAARCSRSFL